jgi:2-polyprenyl-6-methoxyphenol hydroxylase-like FAD-dependent oxidoreductase
VINDVIEVFMSSSIPVLIVGAGPTGLMLACELARYGISFRIIDQKAEPTKTTNAAVLHTRTLEILDHIGIADRFMPLGVQCKGFRIHGKEGQELARISLDQNNSRFQCSLFLPQSQTEKLLNERLAELHGSVERKLELVDVRQESRKIISTIKRENGETETIESDWLIGCDGYKSTVREKTHIPFSGEDLPDEYLVADMLLNSSLSENEGDGFLGTGNLIAFFPIGHHIYRVVARLKREKTDQSLSEEEVRTIVQERSHGLFTLKSILWISSFWIHSKIAERMHQGGVFIAGDAAHVHSPAGGQGMNTGMQDAFNLAWKLALVIKGQAHPFLLLESYQAERHPVIQGVVNMTEKMTKIGLKTNSLLLQLRDGFIKNILGRIPFLQKKASGIFTQLAICYKRSPIIDYQNRIEGNAPWPGARAPDVAIENTSQRLYDYLRNAHHNLLLFTGAHLSDADLNQLKFILQKIKESYSDTITCFVITPNAISDIAHVIIDPSLSISKAYGCTEKPGMCLIRPDLYIALIALRFDLSNIEALLDKYLRTVTRA